MKIATAMTVFGCSLCTGPASGQNDASNGTTARRIFVGVGIGEYDHWPKLPTSVADVTDMKVLLTKDFGFEAPPFLQLLDAGAKRTDIVALIEDKLESFVKPGDDLVFMYSGHGTRRDDTTRKADGSEVDLARAYIVPTDAHWDVRLPNNGQQWSDLVDSVYLLNALASLPARHILVILDSCNSGLAVTGAVGALKGEENVTEESLTQRIGRNIIAATQPDQSAQSSSVEDPKHSVLTGLLFAALQSGGAGSGLHGFVPGKYLGEYVAAVLKDRPGAQQVPVTGTFYGNEGGDVLFHFKVSVTDVTDEAKAELRRGDLDSFQGSAKKLVDAFPSAAQSIWAKYRLDLIRGDIPDAIQKMDALIDMGAKAPLDAPLVDRAGDLYKRLQRMSSFLGYPRGIVPLRIELGPPKGEAWKPVAGQDELGMSRMMYEWPTRRPSVLRITNTSSAPIWLDCVAIESDGYFDNDECGHSMNPGETIDLTVDEERAPEVMEQHFYVRPFGGESNSLAAEPQGVQQAIRIRFVAAVQRALVHP